MAGFIETVREALLAADADRKIVLTRAAAGLWRDDAMTMEGFGEPLDVAAAGRPDHPELVPPQQVPKRGVGTLEGRRSLFHAVAHIEFNAINLALDAVQRFAGMPDDFYRDWLQVAAEEAYHFELIRAHLRHLGADYGDYPAHRGLWEMAEKTADDVLVRMALVPRVLEARGLDVTPGIQARLAQAGDVNGVSLLDIILHDEVGHVAIGTHWFRHMCSERGVDPETTFFRLLAERFPDGLHGPYNVDARRQAGFSPQELARL